MTTGLLALAIVLPVMALAALLLGSRLQSRAKRVRVMIGVLFVSSAIGVAQSAIESVLRESDPGGWRAWTFTVTGVSVISIRLFIAHLGAIDKRLRVSDMVWIVAYTSESVWIMLDTRVHPWIISSYLGLYLQYDLLYWIQVIATYAIIAYPTYALIVARAKVRMLALRSGRFSVLVAAAPVLAHVLTVTVMGPDGFDLTPVGFLVAAVLLWRAYVSQGFADLVPISRTDVFEYLADGIVVIDSQGVVADANSQALALSGAARVDDVIGRSLADVWPEGARLVEVPGEQDVIIAGVQRVLDTTVTALLDPRGKRVGAMVQLRDVTEAATRRRDLARTHSKLRREAKLALQERDELADEVTRDAGTGLRNRRYVKGMLPTLAADCARDGVPLSMAVLDIDYFKNVNDRFGHQVGDRVLYAVARALEDQVPDDLVARLGGEEFVVLLPGVDIDGALSAAEAMRLACERLTVPTRSGDVRVTLSGGVSTADAPDIDTTWLIDAADAALYRAKRAGRNLVRRFDDDRL